MATVTIQVDGGITVSLSSSEHALAQMLREDVGEGALTDVFNLWFKQHTYAVRNARFDALTPSDKTALEEKVALVRPQRGPSGPSPIADVTTYEAPR